MTIIPTARVVPEAASILWPRPLHRSECGSLWRAEYARYMVYTDMTADGKRDPVATSGEMESSVKATKSTMERVMTDTLKEHDPASLGLNMANRKPAGVRHTFDG